MNFIFSFLLFYNLFAETPQPKVENISTIKIGNQEWTTENWNLKTPKSFYYNNDSISWAKYGRLYYFSNAMAATPPGFHLPTLDDWWELINFLGGPNAAGAKMMIGGESGLNLPFAGYKSANISDEDLYGFIDHYAFYWTSTQDGEQTAFAIHIDNHNVIEIESYRRANGFSVRYLKNKTE